MEKDLSYCGLLCSGCPILWATNEPDSKRKEKLKIEIAKMSNELNKTNFTPNDITDCDGCLTENGRLFPGCEVCHIRNCAKEKNLSNCGYCNEYICEKLDNFFKENPESKLRLDFIKRIN
jgi:hypothetical protein